MTYFGTPCASHCCTDSGIAYRGRRYLSRPELERKVERDMIHHVVINELSELRRPSIHSKVGHHCTHPLDGGHAMTRHVT